MLTIDNTALIIIDVQEKLAKAMLNKDALFENLQKIIKGSQVLGIPILVTEQNPKGLGNTVPELSSLLSDAPSVSKFSFSCCGEEQFMQKFKELNRRQVLLAGIEAHVCVYQTAIDLRGMGYEVEVLADCVSSRTAENKARGLEKMKEAGTGLTSTEIALFELLRIAEGEKFKEISKIVK